MEEEIRKVLKGWDGISQRVWLRKINKELSGLISASIGDKWITDLFELKKLLPNIEMKEENGDENIFVFGLHAGEVENLKRTGYNPYSYYQSNR